MWKNCTHGMPLNNRSLIKFNRWNSRTDSIFTRSIAPSADQNCDLMRSLVRAITFATIMHFWTWNHSVIDKRSIHVHYDGSYGNSRKYTNNKTDIHILCGNNEWNFRHFKTYYCYMNFYFEIKTKDDDTATCIYMISTAMHQRCWLKCWRDNLFTSSYSKQIVGVWERKRKQEQHRIKRSFRL